MINQVFIQELIREIKSINRADPSDVEASVEQYLKLKMQGVSNAGRLAIMEDLIQQCKDVSSGAGSSLSLVSNELSELFSLLLGKKVVMDDFSSAELSEKLAVALNTIFDTLNQIIRVIHSTLLGQQAELETIRHIIGSQLEGESSTSSLQEYLNQIQQAFLVAHKAFKQAANTKVSQLLSELDPDSIAAATDSGLKFGPLRKAELFEIYKEKFHALKGSFESGYFTEELVREFEKICKKLYK